VLHILWLQVAIVSALQRVVAADQKQKLHHLLFGAIAVLVVVVLLTLGRNEETLTWIQSIVALVAVVPVVVAVMVLEE